MKCPNHTIDDLSKEDFYWTENKTLKNPNCKKCISKENKEKYQKKKDYYKMFIG